MSRRPQPGPAGIDHTRADGAPAKAPDRRKHRPELSGWALRVAFAGLCTAGAAQCSPAPETVAPFSAPTEADPSRSPPGSFPASELAPLRRRALALLRKDLPEADAYERTVVARVLGEAGDREALAVLERSLHSLDPLENRTAADALGAVGSPESVRILRRLHAESADGQHLALSALRMRKDPALLPLYGKALESPDPALRILGLEVVSELHAREMRDAIERLRGREAHPVVLTYVDYSLASLGDEAGLRRLEQRLRHERVAVRDAAAGLLGSLDHSSIPEALRAALEDPALLVRAAAAASLTRFGDPSGLGAVEQSLGHPDLRARVAAVASLARMHYPTARPLIRKQLDASDPIVRAQAFHLIADNGDGALIERAARAAAADREEFVRVEAVRAMGWLGGGEMVEPLAALLDAPSAAIRHAAAEALLHLTERLGTSTRE